MAKRKAQLALTPEQAQRLGAALSTMLDNERSILFPRLILAVYGKSLVVSTSVTPRFNGKSIKHDTELSSQSLGKCWVRFDPTLSGKPISIANGELPMPADDTDKAKLACEAKRSELASKCPTELDPKLEYDRAAHGANAKLHSLVKVSSDAQLRTACVLARAQRQQLSADRRSSLAKSN